MNPTHDDPWKMLEKRLLVSADSVAIRHAGGSLTFAQLADAATVLATKLAGGFGPHTAAGVLLGMLPEYLVADLTILRSNLVKIPLNPMLSASEMAYILEHAGARVLLTSDRLGAAEVEKAAEVARLLPELVVVDVSIESLLDPTLRTDEAANPGDAAGPASGAEARPAAVPADARPEDPAAIYYTGGTTGKPKGVVHSRRGVAGTILAHALEAEIGSGDVLLLSTSLSHSAGSFAHAALARGATLVLLDRFTPADFCRVAREQRATFAMVVPTMLYRLLDHLAEHPEDTPALDTLVYGSAPITPSRLREAIERFGPIFIQLFGQTEVPNWGTSLGKRDHALALERPELLLSCGTPCMLASVRVVDEEGNDVGPGETGEILLAAPYAMAEYWRNEEATAATLIDGWVHTRDIGQWDERGYLYVRDRKSDMIITGGYNVYSSEVEAELQRMEGVAQVAVIGIPDADWGEAVCAVVVPSAGATLEVQEVLDEARELLGAYKRPKRIVLVDEIPLTPFGKADKKALRAPFWEQAERAI